MDQVPSLHDDGFTYIEEDKSFTLLKLNMDDQEKIKHHNGLDVDITFSSICISVIDDSPQEIMLITLEKLFSNFKDTNEQLSFTFSLGDVQVDNQLYNRPSEVAICSNAARDDAYPVIVTNIEKCKQTIGVSHYPRLEFAIQEIDVCLDSEFVLKVLNVSDVVVDFVENQRSVKGKSKKKDQKSLPQYQIELPAGILEEDGGIQQLVFIEGLKINPAVIHLTFSAIRERQTTSVNIPEEIIEEDEEGFAKLVRRTPLWANISNAKIKLNGLVLLSIFEKKEEIQERIQSHYLGLISSQLFKIIGASDALGSPVNLVRGLGTGFYDFFYEPAKGIQVSPQEFGEGLKKGTLSLVSGTIGGVFGSTAKITGSLARGLSVANTDNAFQQEQEKISREKATNAGYGILQGTLCLGSGLVRGISGVVADPVQAVQQDGLSPSSLGKGMASGLTGLITKPTAGVLGFVSKTAEGVSATTEAGNQKNRKRMPRYFGPDKVLRSFEDTKEKAEGQLLAHKIGLAPGEIFLDQIQLSSTRPSFLKQRRMIITTKRILLTTTPVKKIELKSISSVILDHQNSTIIFEIQRGDKFGSVYHEEIPLPQDQEISSKIHEKVTRTIENFIGMSVKTTMSTNKKVAKYSLDEISRKSRMSTIDLFSKSQQSIELQGFSLSVISFPFLFISFSTSILFYVFFLSFLSLETGDITATHQSVPCPYCESTVNFFFEEKEVSCPNCGICVVWKDEDVKRSSFQIRTTKLSSQPSTPVLSNSPSSSSSSSSSPSSSSSSSTPSSSTPSSSSSNSSTPFPLSSQQPSSTPSLSSSSSSSSSLFLRQQKEKAGTFFSNLF